MFAQIADWKRFTAENKKGTFDKNYQKSLLAVWTGLEPATSAVTGRHSNQLNYHT
ncbi:MAG: hypothetical protein RJA07_1958 [Bacteroidota bacterium]